MKKYAYLLILAILICSCDQKNPIDTSIRPFDTNKVDDGMIIHQYAGHVKELHFRGNRFYLLYGGIDYSEDAGATWHNRSLYSLASRRVSTIDMRGDTIFAGSDIMGAFMSTNNGINWSYIGLGMYPSTTNGIVLDVMIKGDNVLYFTAEGINIYNIKTAQWSFTYSYSYNAGPSQNLNLFVRNNNDIYFTNGKISIMKSTDGGFTWNKFFDSKTLTGRNDYIYSFDINYGKMVAVMGSNVYVSNDLSLTWEKVSNNSKDFENDYITAMYIEDDIVYLGDGYGKFFICNLKTKQCNEINFSSNFYITCIKKNNNVLYAGTNKSGVYYSLNNGISWEKY